MGAPPVKGFRQIQGRLALAERCLRPAFLPKGRPRAAAKLAGLRYERAAAQALEGLAVHGPWFHFEDAKGEGWCQPDLIFPCKALGAAFILEVKLSWVPEAEPKLQGLYLPVVAKALKCKTFGVVLCKNLSPATPGAVHSNLDAALRASLSEGVAMLCWDGRSPETLLPQSAPFAKAHKAAA